MRFTAIAIGVVNSCLITPTFAQTAPPKLEADIIANVTQIENIFELGSSVSDANTAIVSQTGGIPLEGSNAVEINQFHSENRAFIMQESIYPNLFSGQSDNLLNVTQNGFDNTAVGTQFGAANDGRIVQSGSGNTAGITQVGGLLSSTIIQEGSRLSAQSIQTGIGASPIVIHQTGTGAPAVSITRNAP